MLGVITALAVAMRACGSSSIAHAGAVAGHVWTFFGNVRCLRPFVDLGQWMASLLGHLMVHSCGSN
jgi:hypothetical protein